MQQIRLVASFAMTLILIGLVVLLWEPSFAMQAGSRTAGLGSGALPRFCIVAVGVLAVAVLIRDVISYRRNGAIKGNAEIDTETDPRRVLGIGLATLVLLAGFLIGWQLLGFLPSSMAFLATTSMLLLPKVRWTRHMLLPVLMTSILFSIGVWAIFVYLLQVPLR